MEIKKLILQTNVLTKLKIFYEESLGFEVTESQEGYFTLQVGSSELTFEQSETLANYHFAFNIPENQLRESLQFLQNQNIPLETFQEKSIIDFPNWNAHALYFLDPAQNIVEFITRHDLENTSQVEFSAKSITEISEIGFPVPTIKDFYEKMEAEFDIPVYSHISNMTKFCAAGSANGLFIIVPLERNWFPTQLVNGIYPTKVVLEGKEDKAFQFPDLPYEISSIKKPQ